MNKEEIEKIANNVAEITIMVSHIFMERKKLKSVDTDMWRFFHLGIFHGMELGNYGTEADRIAIIEKAKELLENNSEEIERSMINNFNSHTKMDQIDNQIVELLKAGKTVEEVVAELGVEASKVESLLSVANETTEEAPVEGKETEEPTLSENSQDNAGLMPSTEEGEHGVLTPPSQTTGEQTEANQE